MNNNLISNVNDPISNKDVVNLETLNTAVSGLSSVYMPIGDSIATISNTNLNAGATNFNF